ncbi:MAG: TraB/GumN family protein, partial [Bdellovibrionales bacterium]|nr:TraB/GumN family protein [Bdellovibrionales bacterium]
MIFRRLTAKNCLEKIFKFSFLYTPFLALTVSCGPFFPANKPFFWKVEKNEKISYFLGTFHYGIPLEDLPCSKTILTKLRNSDLVLTELGSGVQDAQKEEWEKTFKLSPNNEDFNQLSPESQRFLEQNGISKELTYFHLNYYLTILCLKKAVGEETALTSMDVQVRSAAIYFNIPSQALDTLKLRKPGIKYHTTKEDIENKIKNFHLCPKYIQYGIAAYKMGNKLFTTKGLNKWLHNRYSTSESDKWLLKHRNEKWATQFKEAHENHDHIFIAAGSFHFTEPFNLIDMLRR